VPKVSKVKKTSEENIAKKLRNQCLKSEEQCLKCTKVPKVTKTMWRHTLPLL